MEKTVDENQTRGQTSFRNGYSTFDHLKKSIEKCKEFNIPLCVGYIDFKQAFDSTEFKAIFKASTTKGKDATIVTILEDTYTGAAAKEHTDNQFTRKIPIHRGVSQNDPISSNLFTATIREVFKHFQREGIHVGEQPSDLRLADGVTLTTESVKGMEIDQTS